MHAASETINPASPVCIGFCCKDNTLAMYNLKKRVRDRLAINTHDDTLQTTTLAKHYVNDG